MILIAVPDVVVVSETGAEIGVEGGDAIVTEMYEELTDNPAIFYASIKNITVNPTGLVGKLVTLNESSDGYPLTYVA
jgi:hypothetical protein